jgi:peptidoglycan/LPS O-acetylase OafA/YrhL
MQARARKSLDALTGARFLAAYWVLLYHFTIQFRYVALPGKPTSSHAIPALVAPILLQGHLGVDFFFLLSGFILAYTYLSDTATLRGSKREFWVARVARIYPVYLLGLILALPDLLTALPSGTLGWLFVMGAAVLHLLLLHAWIPVGTNWNQPSWSLSVEAAFYLGFPLILPLVARLRQRGLWLLTLGSWLGYGALSLVLQFFTNTGVANLIPDWRDFVRYLPLVSYPEFIAGMALGLLFTRYRAEALSGILRLAQRYGWINDGLVIIALTLLLGALTLIYQLGLANSPIDIAAPFALPPLAAITLLLAFQRGVIARLLSTRLMVWLGEVSYAVYMLQDPLWARLNRPLWALVNGLSLIVTQRTANNAELLIAITLLLVICASLSFKFFETPLRRWIRATWASSGPQRSTAQVTPASEGART